MYSIDFQNQLDDYLSDERRKIPEAHLNSVCKKDQKNACRYIGLCQIGFVCAKKTPIKPRLDDLAKNTKFSAKYPL